MISQARSLTSARDAWETGTINLGSYLGTFGTVYRRAAKSNSAAAE